MEQLRIFAGFLDKSLFSRMEKNTYAENLVKEFYTMIAIKATADTYSNH